MKKAKSKKKINLISVTDRERESKMKNLYDQHMDNVINANNEVQEQLIGKLNTADEISESQQTLVIAEQFTKEEIILRKVNIAQLYRELLDNNLSEKEKYAKRGQIKFLEKQIKSAETDQPWDETEENASWVDEIFADATIPMHLFFIQEETHELELACV